jgi:uncharacterized membrane protein
VHREVPNLADATPRAAPPAEHHMSEPASEMNRRAVRPVVCFQEGWKLIKDEYWLFFGMTFLTVLIGQLVPLGILLGPLMCGLEIALLRRMSRRPVTFNHLFEGFNYFGHSVVATLFVVIPAIFIGLFFYFAFVAAFLAVFIPRVQQGGPPDATFFVEFIGLILVYTLALIVLSILVSAPMIFMYSLIVEREVTGVQAFGMSMRAIFANFWGIMGLLLLNMLLSMAGALICIGAWLLMPISMAANAVAYRQVFPPPRREVEVAEAEAMESEPVEAGSADTGIRAESPRLEPPSTGITPE